MVRSKWVKYNVCGNYSFKHQYYNSLSWTNPICVLSSHEHYLVIWSQCAYFADEDYHLFQVCNLWKNDKTHHFYEQRRVTFLAVLIWKILDLLVLVSICQSTLLVNNHISSSSIPAFINYDSTNSIISFGDTDYLYTN